MCFSDWVEAPVIGWVAFVFYCFTDPVEDDLVSRSSHPGWLGTLRCLDLRGFIYIAYVPVFFWYIWDHVFGAVFMPVGLRCPSCSGCAIFSSVAVFFLFFLRRWHRIMEIGAYNSE